MLKDEPIFEWDALKDLDNQLKHGVSFKDARHAFNDENNIILADLTHSDNEYRFYCYGKDRHGRGVLTVRFTYRSGKIRIFGAGYWRKGKRVYEQKNKIHKRPD